LQVKHQTGRVDVARFLFLSCFSACALAQGGSSLPGGRAPDASPAPGSSATTQSPEQEAAKTCSTVSGRERERCVQRAMRAAKSSAVDQGAGRGSADRVGPGSTGMGR